ncbi:hypothetical protein V9T40_007352 [Parthenolecanium corni]|uniref:RING-type domain-containing protein n=1 Tax=Parthenolecanium corni TaxID=536013 RepID=A0AAN9YBJ2_9HEMI
MTPSPNAVNIAPNCPAMDDNQLPPDEPPASRSRHISFKNSDLADLNLFRESDRLRTFENWPVPFIDKKDLANAGFYYTNRGDSVKCPFCNIKVGCWCINDDPLTEHETHSPNCTFIVRRKSAAQNHEDIDLECLPADEAGPYNFSGEDTCGPVGIQGRQSPALILQTMSRESMYEKLNVNCTESPVFPLYSTHSDRLKTFSNWPLESRLSPEALSEAGFFYTGEQDRAACFQCGGALHHWDPTDDPWVEHALWFPNCKYVQSIKGQKFIDLARQRKHEGLARTQEEIQAAIDTFKELVCKGDANKVNPNDKVNESSSEGTSGYESESPSSQEIAANEAKADAESRMTCLICLEAERDSILLPCYHMVACQNCANKLTKCCFCREPVFFRRRVFMP